MSRHRHRSVLKLLRDIQGAGPSIQAYIAGMVDADYSANQAIRRAVEREYEISGEALRRHSVSHPDIFARVSHARQIIAFRNVLAHGYDVVEDAVVWEIIHKRLPELMREVDTLSLMEQAR